MRLRELFLSLTMVCLTFVTANAFKVTPPSPLLAEDEIFRAAYDDTVKILSEQNKCSDFFGGPAASLEVFRDLIAAARKEFFASSIGIQMSGATTKVSNAKTGRKHRYFDKVSINSNGPFYRQRLSETQGTVPTVGRFQPNTREARVLMLLHELGHIVETEGKWLLPDDGHDAELSRSNTRKIEDVCGRQIRNLGKGDRALNGVNGKYRDERPAPVAAAP